MKTFAWLNAKADRSLMVDKLVKGLGNITKNKYDFSRYSKGDGVNEFRKKMRSFIVEARAMNGLITPFNLGTGPSILSH